VAAISTPLATRAPSGLEQRPEQVCRQRRKPVMEWAVFEKRFSGQVRHDPVSVLEHLVHDADADGVFGFPGIVPDEPWQQVR